MDKSHDSGPEHRIRVLVADDHSLVRRRLRLLLDSVPGIEVIAEAADLHGVIQHLHAHRPEVLVLDLGMPDAPAVETIERLRRRMPDTEIVVLTMEDVPAFGELALDAGAVGFVLKEYADVEPPAGRSGGSPRERSTSARTWLRTGPPPH